MQQRILVFVAFLFSFVQPNLAQTFYNLDSIQTIEIHFDQANWDYLLDTAKQGTEETYLVAAWVKINGEQFDSLGVKYKGNSSYNPNNAKNPMHIELDHIINGQNYQGFTDVKLGNGFSDPSFVREPLAYFFLRNYMDEPRANFARVFINGTYFGVYTSAESINKDWVRDHNYADGHALVKCNPKFVGGPGGGTGSNLAYLGADSASYKNNYELKSDYGWAELIHLCDTLNNKPAALDEILDVDKMIWMLAFNNITVNLDSYTGAFRQNYYLFRDQNARFASIVWDLNMCFGSFGNIGGGSPGGANLTTLQQLALDVHSTDSGWPLIKQVYANPTWRRMYIAHARTFLQEAIVSGEYVAKAQELMATIADAVAADTKKFFTTTQFQNSLDQSATPGGGGLNAPGIRQLMNGRAIWLQNNAAMQAVPPALDNIISNPAAPPVGTSFFLTASAPGATYVRLGWRSKTTDRFHYLAMFDDGAHGDGAASDGVYGVQLIMTAQAIQYYVYAENASAGIFSPQRAEHEFHVLVSDIPAVMAGEVVINEVMPLNTSTAADQNGEYDDWIELLNTTGHPIDLSGSYLSDNQLNQAKWAFPSGTTIAPGQYLIVWADEDGSQPGLHANFKLAAGGERVTLSDASGFNKVDEIEFANAVPDVSFARCPDGTGAFGLAAPTFQSANCVVDTHQPGETPGSGVYLSPNPATNELWMRSESGLGNTRLFDWSGNTLMVLDIGNQVTEMRINISDLPAGIYFVRTAAGAIGKWIKI